MAERKRPAVSDKNDAEALAWLKENHAAPCDDPKCDSVYCYIAGRLATARASLADAAHWQQAFQELRDRARAGLADTERLDWLDARQLDVRHADEGGEGFENVEFEVLYIMSGELRERIDRERTKRSGREANE